MIFKVINQNQMFSLFFFVLFILSNHLLIFLKVSPVGKSLPVELIDY